MRQSGSREFWAPVEASSGVLGFVFVCAAIGKLARYLPWWGLVLVAIAQAAALSLLARHARSVLDRVTRRRAWIVLGAVAGLLSLVYLWGHPALERSIANRPGLGSDRDEALEVAVGSLFSSGRPYLAEISTGNPISPMPGELMLAAPFVWLGVSGLQTVFWLLLWCLLLSLRFGVPRAVLALALLLALSPGVLHEVLTAGDLLAASLYNAVACTWLLVPAAEPERVGPKDLAGALLFALALSSRPTFLLLVPLLVAALAPTRGVPFGLGIAALSVGLTSLLTWFYARGIELTRSPFHLLITIDELSFPGAWLTIALISALMALGGARSVYRSGGETFHTVSALVLLVPVVLSTTLVARTLGAAAVERFLWYALWSLPFAAVGLVGVLTGRGSVRRSSRVHRAAPS
jgi:hypothetical protein